MFGASEISRKSHFQDVQPLPQEDSKHKITSLLEKTLVPNEEMAIHAIKATNIFPSHDERQRTLQMAALANLIYKDLKKEMAEIDSLFPRGLIMLPTPEEMGVDLPRGLRVQAFRHGDEVIVAMRGTEITQDVMTAIANIVADAGIGRHKSKEDILNSVDLVKARLKKLYGYELDDTLYNGFETVLNERLEGDSDQEIAMSYGKEIVKNAGKEGLIGTGIAAAVSGVSAVALIGLGLLSGPLGLVLLGGGALFGGVSGAAVGTGKTVVKKSMMLADGYPTITNYIKAIDCYIQQLKKTKIRDTDTLITTGHSLGGFLSGVSGAMNADEAFSFNGPGVIHDKDVKHIARNLGLDRKIHSHFHLHTTSMEGDFIGNFGKRDGSMKTLYLPITLGESTNFPSCNYENILSHHGIHLIKALLDHSTMESLPKRTPVLLLEGSREEPQVEEIDD